MLLESCGLRVFWFAWFGFGCLRFVGGFVYGFWLALCLLFLGLVLVDSVWLPWFGCVSLRLFLVFRLL